MKPPESAVATAVAPAPRSSLQIGSGLQGSLTLASTNFLRLHLFDQFVIHRLTASGLLGELGDDWDSSTVTAACSVTAATSEWCRWVLLEVGGGRHLAPGCAASSAQRFAISRCLC